MGVGLDKLSKTGRGGLRGRMGCRQQFGWMIWDLERYHKYYLQQNRGQAFKKRDALDYSVILKIVPDEKGDWSATKQTAASLKKEFKIIEQTPKGETNSAQKGTKKVH